MNEIEEDFGNEKNDKEIFEQFIKKQQQQQEQSAQEQDQKNIDNILNKMPEEDRIYMIVDKDSGVIIDSRNEEIVAQLFNSDAKQVQIKNDNQIWKDFWKQVRQLNYLLIDASESGELDTLIDILDKQAKRFPIDINYK